MPCKEQSVFMEIYNFPFLQKAILEAEISSSLGGHSLWMEAEYHTFDQDFLSLAEGNSAGTKPSSKTSSLLPMPKLYPHMNLLPVAILHKIEAARSVGLSH